jgi:hypothetical protein
LRKRPKIKYKHLKPIKLLSLKDFLIVSCSYFFIAAFLLFIFISLGHLDINEPATQVIISIIFLIYIIMLTSYLKMGLSIEKRGFIWHGFLDKRIVHLDDIKGYRLDGDSFEIQTKSEGDIVKIKHYYENSLLLLRYLKQHYEELFSSSLIYSSNDGKSRDKEKRKDKWTPKQFSLRL